MTCYHLRPIYYSVGDDGKKKLHFSGHMTEIATDFFCRGLPFPKFVRDRILMLPCGSCIGCRLERSRQWAVRISHEASLYKQNSFLTLTFNNDSLARECPAGSLSRKVISDFMKRLRRQLDYYFDKKIRFFYCGEYGERFQRPHYHVCLFNHDFSDDRVLWKRVRGFPLYTSDFLSRVWGFGRAVIGGLSFESAAYVARYCTKKITGSAAGQHYEGRLPEFCQASLKPGIGHAWLEKFGESDVFAYDDLVVRGHHCKPPRYYDKYLERLDPVRFESMKRLRVARASLNASDNTYARLKKKERCQMRRFEKLIRCIEELEEC